MRFSTIFYPVYALVFLCAAAHSFGATSETQPVTTGGYRIIGAGITGASQLQPDAGKQSKLTLKSSDEQLVKAFDWAKRQACSYARDEGDPVGAWYEGGEPGRESFCMRDISHQVMGGHALGLVKHNFNMLHRFAENIAESRDWCSYWGMTRMNLPRRVDYRDDSRFWYCLPANFDVVAACCRMYLWTANPAYINDPVFLNFYEHSMTDYVERWALGPEAIMTRPRLLNVRGIFDPSDKFQPNRGLPGYDEQTKGYTAGSDLIGKEYAAFVAYAYIQDMRGRQDQAQKFMEKAVELRKLINTAWWNEAGQYFYQRLDKDHKGEGRGGAIFLLHDAVDDAKIKGALGGDNGGRGGAEILYKYGQADAAYERMLYTALDPRSRREYPETSFSWVGTLVNGTMGINLEAPAPYDAWVKGYWVDKVVRTLPGLGTKVAWTELSELPVRANTIAVRHDGVRKTRVINQHGPAFIWQACFAGAHESLLVNGNPAKALVEQGPLGEVSSVRVTIGAGGGATVEVP